MHVVVMLFAMSMAAPAADAQVLAAWYPAPAVVAPPPVLVPPPVPVIGYYAQPVVRFTPGYYFGSARPAPLPRAYGYRQRIRVRRPLYRGAVRLRGW